jgi:sporulation-control protein spo0M
MTETGQVKETVEQEEIIAELAEKVRQLQSEVERKNQALEGFLAENEALKEELGGRKKSLRHAPESLETKIERWKKRS